MKQIWPNYSYSPTTNVLTLTGLNIDRDQLLLVTAADRGRIMYNFADSSVTASAFTSGVNTALTLVATTAGLTTTAALVIYYDDQLTSTTVTVSSIPAISGTVTANVVGFNSAEAFGTGVIQDISDIERDTIRASLWIADSSAPNGTAGNGQILSQSYPMPISGTVTIGSALPAGTNRIGVVTASLSAGTAQIGSVTASISNFPATQVISGTVTAGGRWYDGANYQPTPFDVTEDGALYTIATLESALPAGTNRIGVVTIGGGTVTIGASTAQIGSVTASISGTVPISISSVTVGNSVTIGSLPAISGTVTANTFALQGTAVTTSNFTSTTASTVLASYNATREVLTIFNEGAGNLHICAGATCTTIAYQVRLSAGDYYEVPNHQTTITHSAVFATAGTARVTEVS